ncbi:hypothetical protein BY996DRAFT_6566997 [Phakopsora pachyrhizi]|nr:hypothetical protein BY996DRAFT_6566997 [Phakopsora pachyrhizi]
MKKNAGQRMRKEKKSKGKPPIDGKKAISDTTIHPASSAANHLTSSIKSRFKILDKHWHLLGIAS